MKANVLAPASKHFALHLLALATAASALVLTSCNKDKDDPKPKTKTELLTAKNWRVTAEVTTVVANGTTTTEDEYAQYEACQKDDYLKFETNKVVKFDEGALKCDGNPQTQTGTWDFNSDQTKISLSNSEFGPLVVPFEIVDLTETTLKVKVTIVSTPESSTTVAYTYTAF